MRRCRKKTGTETEASRRIGWQRILAPIDFSKTSLRALEVAARLAGDHRARLILLFAIEPAGYLTGMESVAMVVPDSAIAREAKQNLPRIARRFIPATVPVTILLEKGRPSDVIRRVAYKKKIDLIVLSTHGRTGVDRFLMGSTAEQVVRHARCPVLVVRPAIKTNTKHKSRKD